MDIAMRFILHLLKLAGVELLRVLLLPFAMLGLIVVSVLVWLIEEHERFKR